MYIKRLPCASTRATSSNENQRIYSLAPFSDRIGSKHLFFLMLFRFSGLQEIAQSAGTTPNEAKVTSSNPPPPLVWTCQKKKIPF
jgi:hypothetical protein